MLWQTIATLIREDELALYLDDYRVDYINGKYLVYTDAVMPSHWQPASDKRHDTFEGAVSEALALHRG